MRDGRFTQVGSPQHVYRQPNDRFTAEFLGDCIALPCTVASGVADCALGRVPVQASIADGPATLVLRPEQLVATVVSDSEQLDGVGTVIATEFLGHDVLLTIDPAGDAAPIIVRQHSLNPPPIDAKVRIEVVGTGVVLEMSRTPRPSARPRRTSGRADRHTAADLPRTRRPRRRRRAGTRWTAQPGVARNPQRPGHFGALPGALAGGHVVVPVPAGRDHAAIVQTYEPDVVIDANGIHHRHRGGTHRLHHDLALLLSTSGSTGSPKLVRLSHRTSSPTRPRSPNTSTSAKPTGPQPLCRCRTATGFR